MGETLTEFIKHAGLFTLLHLFITAILILISVVLLIVARSNKAMWWFLGIGIVPAVSGILTMYVKNRILDTGRGMFGRLGPAEIALGRREALIDLIVGVFATVVILVMRAWRGRLNVRADG